MAATVRFRRRQYRANHSRESQRDSVTQPPTRRTPVPVFIATTVMLSFISFWRAAAIVLSDLASSAYYAGGDAEKVIGRSAPWFIRDF